METSVFDGTIPIFRAAEIAKIAGRWGGGDRFEGGANSIYSGWTNAPIAWVFLSAAGAGDLFPDR